MLDLLERAPTVSEWIDDISTSIADNMEADAEEIEEQIKAAIVIGMLIGEEAANVKID